MKVHRVVATLVMLGLCSPVSARAQENDLPSLGGLLQGGPGTDQPLSLRRGSGVFHGNYCGIGDNGPGLPPVDALDLACMHHDACTPSGGEPSCGCNARFAHETQRVVDSPRQPDDLRALAGIVKAGIAFIPCHS